jgi:hypothetical protein
LSHRTEINSDEVCVSLNTPLGANEIKQFQDLWALGVLGLLPDFLEQGITSLTLLRLPQSCLTSNQSVFDALVQIARQYPKHKLQ